MRGCKPRSTAEHLRAWYKKITVPDSSSSPDLSPAFDAALQEYLSLERPPVGWHAGYARAIEDMDNYIDTLTRMAAQVKEQMQRRRLYYLKTESQDASSQDEEWQDQALPVHQERQERRQEGQDAHEGQR